MLVGNHRLEVIDNSQTKPRTRNGANPHQHHLTCGECFSHAPIPELTENQLANPGLKTPELESNRGRRLPASGATSGEEFLIPDGAEQELPPKGWSATHSTHR
jgi:hypothetical protein